jgi:hypothetical protein
VSAVTRDSDPRTVRKTRSWARGLLQRGLLGDGAGVRVRPDEVVDVPERPPVPHLCGTNAKPITRSEPWTVNHPGKKKRSDWPATSDAGSLPGRHHRPPVLVRHPPLHYRREKIGWERRRLLVTHEKGGGLSGACRTSLAEQDTDGARGQNLKEGTPNG